MGNVLILNIFVIAMLFAIGLRTREYFGTAQTGPGIAQESAPGVYLSRI